MPPKAASTKKKAAPAAATKKAAAAAATVAAAAGTQAVTPPIPEVVVGDALAAAQGDATDSAKSFSATMPVPGLPHEIARTGISQVVSYCLSTINGAEAAWKTVKDVSRMQPLPVLASKKKGANKDMSSYKEAWNRARCLTSLQSNGMYEAGYSVFGLDPFPLRGGNYTQDVTWAEVFDASKFFDEAAVTIRAQKQGDTYRRIVFPVEIQVHAASRAVFDVEEIDRRMITTTAGHAWIQAFYWRLGLALQAAQGDINDKTVVALVQCGLTVTVLVRVGLNNHELAVMSCQYSEKLKCDGRMSDTFVTFARKAVAVLGIKHASSTVKVKAARLNELHVKFGAATISDSMMLAVVYATDPSKLCSKAIEIIRCIYATYGRECIGGYAKLLCIVQSCQKDADHTANSCAVLSLYFLTWLHWRLRTSLLLHPSSVTVEWLVGSKKHSRSKSKKAERGTSYIGAVRVCLARRDLVHNHIASWVQDMRSLKENDPAIIAEMDQVLMAFVDYAAYEETFHVPALGGVAGQYNTAMSTHDSTTIIGEACDDDANPFAARDEFKAHLFSGFEAWGRSSKAHGRLSRFGAGET